VIYITFSLSSLMDRNGGGWSKLQEKLEIIEINRGFSQIYTDSILFTFLIRNRNKNSFSPCESAQIRG